MADPAASKPPGLIARVTAWALTLKPVRAILLYIERRGPMLADSITYRTLFSVFAGVLLGFSIAALWLSDNPVAWEALIDGVNAAIPGLLGEDGLIDPESIKAPEAINLAGILSFIGLVGAAIGAIGSLRVALRTLADRLTDDIFWVWVILRNLVLAILLGGLLAAAAGATYLGSSLLGVVRGWMGISARDPIAGAGRDRPLGRHRLRPRRGRDRADVPMALGAAALRQDAVARRAARRCRTERRCSSSRTCSSRAPPTTPCSRRSRRSSLCCCGSTCRRR